MALAAPYETTLEEVARPYDNHPAIMVADLLATIAEVLRPVRGITLSLLTTAAATIMITVMITSL
jgi:hypothetical protein